MKKKSAYFIGIKGVAMTSLATYLKQKGFFITGSDIKEKFSTDEILDSQNITIKNGFYGNNIDRIYDFVVVTGAHGGMTNPEAQQARLMKIPTYMHGEILGRLMSNINSMSVAGCHGKTTTSSLISSLLTHAGLDPSYTTGTSYINDLGFAGHYGKGEWFIAEADEYMTCPLTDRTPRFMWQNPKILVVTNIDYDHPDAYKDIDEVIKAYHMFINKLSKDSIVIACIDDKNIARLLPSCDKKVITYGYSPAANFRISKNYFSEGVSFMRIIHQKIELGEFMLHLPGKHNLLNALAACIAANIIGISWETLRKNMKKFTGTKRRFEKKCEIGNILFLDDYAHHPTEIQSTLQSLRDWYPNKKILVIFQPHTFSRTKALFEQFAKSFKLVDRVIFTDIYASAREKYDKTIHSNILTLKANTYKKNAQYCSDKNQVLNFLVNNIKNYDIVVTMGAGNIFSWDKDIIKILENTD